MMQPDDLEGHGSDIVEVMLAYDHCGGANMTKPGEGFNR
jgi:hypothetical protein